MRSETPEIPEIELVLSSDEELEEKYRRAIRLPQGLRIPPQPSVPRRQRVMTPPPIREY